MRTQRPQALRLGATGQTAVQAGDPAIDRLDLAEVTQALYVAQERRSALITQQLALQTTREVQRTSAAAVQWRRQYAALTVELRQAKVTVGLLTRRKDQLERVGSPHEWSFDRLIAEIDRLTGQASYLTKLLRQRMALMDGQASAEAGDALVQQDRLARGSFPELGTLQPGPKAHGGKVPA